MPDEEGVVQVAKHRTGTLQGCPHPVCVEARHLHAHHLDRPEPQAITTVEQIRELHPNTWLLGSTGWPDPKPQLWRAGQMARDPRIYLRAYGPFTIVKEGGG